MGGEQRGGERKQIKNSLIALSAPGVFMEMCFWRSVIFLLHRRVTLGNGVERSIDFGSPSGNSWRTWPGAWLDGTSESTCLQKRTFIPKTQTKPLPAIVERPWHPLAPVAPPLLSHCSLLSLQTWTSLSSLWYLQHLLSNIQTFQSPPSSSEVKSIPINQPWRTNCLRLKWTCVEKRPSCSLKLKRPF